MKRITPEEVLEAYEKTGLKPMQGDYYPEDGCACGLGVIATYKIGKSDGEDAYHFVSETYGTEYGQYFADGFDGNLSRNHLGELAHNELAYEDGKAAWEAVKHLATESLKKGE